MSFAGITSIATGGVDGGAALAAGLTPFWHFAGAFHPAVVHFPIALLMVAGLVEGVAIARRRPYAPLGNTAFTCLWLGAIAAVVATLLGWANQVRGR